MKKILRALMCLFVGAYLIFAQGSQFEFKTVSDPQVRLTTHWVFVVDTSSSVKSVFEKSRVAFMEATRSPTDELFFSLLTFNNAGNETWMGHPRRDNPNNPPVNRWKEATSEELKKADEFISQHGGVRSFGAKAILKALHEHENKLTIVLISDGGFSEGFDAMRDAIQEGQTWRANNGLDSAIIASIGIENLYFTAGHKPPDAQCQAFLKEIGEVWLGGYFLVRSSSD